MTRLKELKTPVFWAEGHPGMLDRESWEIEVTGLCDAPQKFTWARIAGDAEDCRGCAAYKRHAVYRPGKLGRGTAP